MDFISSTTSILALAATGAFVALPASRKLLLGSTTEEWLCDELPFDRIEEDRCTVRLKDGSYFRIWHLAGTAYEAKPETVQVNHALIRSQIFRLLLTSNQSLRLIGIKRRKDNSYAAIWPSVTLDEIGRAEQHVNKNAFDISWVLIQHSSSFHTLEKNRTDIRATLDEYGAELLHTPKEPDASCPITNLINYLVCGELRHDLTATSLAISANIPASDFALTNKGEITTFTPHKQNHRCIAIRQWPDSISGELIGRLLALDGEIELSQICLPQERTKTLNKLWVKQRQLQSPLGRNEEHAGEHDYIRTNISADKICLSETQFQLFIRAQTEEELTRLIDQATDILSRARVVWSIEATGAAVSCWFNRLPGHDKLSRPLRIQDHNISVLWPFPYSPQGLKKSCLSPNPVRTFSTPAGVPYDFQFHCSDKPQTLANFLIFGQAGSGKTTFIMYVLAGLAKIPAFRSFVFDSNEGMRFMVESFGGTYQAYDNLTFNPLDIAKDTKSNRQRLHHMIRNMIGQYLDDVMHDDIGYFIDTALSIGIEHRTFNKLFRTGARNGSAFKQALEKWVTTEKGKEGPYSHVFNDDRDGLRSFLDQAFMTGINMNEALSDETLGPAVVYHITNAISSLAKEIGSPYGIFIDEAANLLKNEAFRVDFATVMYREIRKMDGFIGLAFQDPSALAAFPKEAEAIISNTSTFIFFPNATYDEAALEQFKFSKEQLDFVLGRNLVSGERRVLILKRDPASGVEESAIVNVDLSALGNALRHFRSGPEANRHLEKIKAEGGEQWLHLL